jgi:hypothetical protein
MKTDRIAELTKELEDCAVTGTPGSAAFKRRKVQQVVPLLLAAGRERDTRRWCYGLTADEWFHLASEGDDSEIAPCCGNLGDIRDLIRTLMTFQAADDISWRKSVGRHLLKSVEADGEGHGLQDREKFPLLHRVLDGIKAEERGELS